MAPHGCFHEIFDEYNRISGVENPNYNRKRKFVVSSSSGFGCVSVSAGSIFDLWRVGYSDFDATADFACHSQRMPNSYLVPHPRAADA